MDALEVLTRQWSKYQKNIYQIFKNKYIVVTRVTTAGMCISTWWLLTAYSQSDFEQMKF